MHDQLKRLEELQTHDVKIQEITVQLEAIPKKIGATENDLAKVEGLLAAERSQLEDARKYLREQQGLLQMEQAQLSAAKQKLSQAKLPREAAAAQREIEQTREMSTNRSTEIKKLVEAVEKKEAVLIERDKEVQALRDHVSEDQGTANEKLAGLQSKVDKLQKERLALTEGLPSSLLKRYSQIRKRKGGNALAPILNGTCTMCNMNIPPQLYLELKRGNVVEACPYCYRIMYCAPEPETPAAPAESASVKETAAKAES